MVILGDRIKMTVELISAIAIEAGMLFAIREGGHTIGADIVSKILTLDIIYKCVIFIL